MRELRFALCALGLMGVTAFADPLTETEPNDDAASANFIDDSFYPFGAVAIDGSICESAGDAEDFFSFDLITLDVITVSVYSLTMGGDPALQVLRPDESVLAFNDDAFGLNPFLGTTIDTDGLHYVRVFGGNPAGDDCFDYKLAFAINPIPEPATAGLLLLGALGLIRRNRN